MNNSEGSIEFKIKSEELIIKDEVDDPTYELTATEANNDSSQDQRFVVIKSDVGPPHYIFDRFTNILMKVNLPENVAFSQHQINPDKQDVNEPCNSTILGQGKHKIGIIKRKPCKCPVCQKQFTRKGDLTRHILRHEGKKPYKCKKCQKQFTQKSDLTRHILIHEGKKPHKCKECQKQFTLKGTLTMHMLIHEGIKPYKCQECQKQFTQHSNLKMHMLIHEGKRPYECQVCQKRYNHNSNLRRHTLKHKSKKR